VKMPFVFQHRPLIASIGIDRAPAEVFQRLYASDRHAFLYESMENEKRRGRFSFVGGRPAIVFQARGKRCKVALSNKTEFYRKNPFIYLEAIMQRGKMKTIHGVFSGGAVGYIAYDAVRHIERLPDGNPEEPRLPEFNFIFPTEIVIFDHHEKTISVICYRSEKRLQELIAVLRERTRVADRPSYNKRKINLTSNMKRRQFCSIVKRAKKYIRCGDVFQVVLSQRFVAPITAAPFSVYCNLRRTNPSPYMYFLKLGNLAVLGSSPETLIKLHKDEVVSVPIAGTRPRGSDRKEDDRMANDLINDEKERAEHVMLVDLARNDVGRVSVYGSVKAAELMKIERFSKVMHITSRVTGDLMPGLNAFDVFRAAFPAGTVSGAPKVRAMEIIDELEVSRRGIYAGAIGYFSFDGNMDFCIAIRTIVIYQNKAYIQSGAGIVADSVPEREYEETLHKMDALKKAVQIAP
jgi:anthranilate synthase component 1